MQELKKNAFSYATFSLFKKFPELVHATFLRPHDFCDNNMEKLAKKIIKEWNLDGLVYCNQIHQDNIHIVKNVKKNSILCLSHTDALITEQKNIVLCVRHADCQAALLYDKYNQVIAIVHAGWRGLVQNIYKKVISTMQEEFSTHPKNLFVCVSPSLGPAVSKYTHYREVFPSYFYKFQIAPFRFDFWQLGKYQLREMGIPTNNIAISEICTFSNANYFSYRRTKTQMRNASLIGNKNK